MPEYSTVILTIPKEDGFTYRIPAGLSGLVKTGVQVIVPFQTRYTAGIVIETGTKLPEGLQAEDVKEIHDIVSVAPLLATDLVRLLKWISDYYICTLGEAYRLIQSQLNVGRSRQVVRRIHPEISDSLTPQDRRLLERIPCDNEIELKKLKKQIGATGLAARLSRLEQDGYISRSWSMVKKKVRFRTEDYYSFMRTPENEDEYQKVQDGRSARSREALSYLEGKGWLSVSDLKNNEISRTILEKLVEQKLLQKKTEIRERPVSMNYSEEVAHVELSPEQREIVQTIEKPVKDSRFETFLLHGITGSGKTQIYIEVIRKVLEIGKQAIVLIPEIVLTPQTLVRFQYHFGDKVGIIHSRLSAGEKREMLHRIRLGDFRVVIGPRSAIFAPTKNLGLVVVDEEHEGSYKQTDAQPRYHARDVAIYRAKLNNATVILGSATPSFESLYNAQQGIYQYFRLGKRITRRSLPRIALVDLKAEWKKGGDYPVVSEGLELKLESRLLTREQTMILQNRRGYSPFILCQECGFVSKCPECEITLTYHQANHSLICHYCGYRENAPDVCPVCQGMDIVYRGVGTQRLEEVLKNNFAGVRILRMDQDTTRGKHGHLNLLEKFRSGEADVLLGTKMIAKGLDFQKVTLVGIVSADQGLHFPDFRSSEKVFQLLTQAAGRAGRGSNAGEVVVQTFDPGHFIFKFLMTHDYQAFFEREMVSRKGLKYPPFSRLILIRLEGKELPVVEQHAEAVVRFLWKTNKKRMYTVLGPAPSPIPKIQQTYRYQILIKQDKEKDPSLKYVRQVLKEGLILRNNIRSWPVNVVIDVDPVEIL